MSKKDLRVDAYIEKSADFAKQILEHLRAVVHAAVPQVEETMKWELSPFHVQRHARQHGVLQGSLRLRVLERFAPV